MLVFSMQLIKEIVDGFINSVKSCEPIVDFRFWFWRYL